MIMAVTSSTGQIRVMLEGRFWPQRQQVFLHLGQV
jgi:hypothetical protein